MKQSFGFTIIELLVVIGIFGLLAAVGLYFSMDFFRTYSTNSEEIILVSALSKARSQSLANINQHAHGVRVTPNNYIIFETPAGVDFDSRAQVLKDKDQILTVNSMIRPTSSTDVVFDQVSGDATCIGGCTLTLSGQGYTKTVTVNDQGAIAW